MATAADPNVLIISVDTLRYDRLGTYGYPKNTTPYIDNFAKKSTVFTEAFTPIPNTYPSYVSLFSGLYPSHHKEFNLKKSSGINKNITMLAESFKKINYNTGAFISNKMLKYSPQGLSRGFDTYDDVCLLYTSPSPRD